MQDTALLFVMLLETAVVGGMFLLYPRIARKGLLFGVYVGEAAAEGEPARTITRSWYRWMIAALAACLVGGVVLFIVAPHPLPAVTPMFLLLFAFLALYLRAYFLARALALAGPPPGAVAPAVTIPSTSPLLPALALVAGAGCGLIALAYAWARYPELPASIPTHFGASGRPDAWRDKSLATVMLLPLVTLVMGTMVGGVAWLTAHAKRALRSADSGASLHAQMRFRAAVTRLVSTLAILVTGMMTITSIQSTRVALGETQGLGYAVPALAAAIAFIAIGGTLYIALHYGQGGSRLEKARVDTPLTDGLADNRNWFLGVFYVNRDDPSILVERRFGFGYTLNFGNMKAVALIVGFLAVMIAIAVAAG